MVARSGTMPAAGGQGSAAQIPWGWLGYAEVTANQTLITTEVDLTSLSVAVTAGTSRRIEITVECMADSTVSTDHVALYIKEGATYLQQRHLSIQRVGSGHSVTATVVLTPSAGTHTYKAAMARVAGTGNITMQAAATYPAFIRIKDTGPA